VAAVTAGGEAEHAWLQLGDIILEIDGAPAGQDASQGLSRLNAGDTITVKIRSRRGGERELQWKVGSREEVSYALHSVENITAQQRARRAAWLKGEAEIPPELQSH